jgi:ATP-dependent RNA helicase DDX35
MVRAVSIRTQLKRYLERLGVEVDESLVTNSSRISDANKVEQVRKCLTAGYFAHGAKMMPDGTFKSVAGGVVLHAHPTSLMFVSGSILALLDYVKVNLTRRTAKPSM